MSFEIFETSPYSGSPERLFLFRVGNQQWAYVNHAKPVVRGARTYTPEIITMSNITQNLGEAPPSIDIDLSSSAAVVQQFVPYQPIFPMQVTVFRRHRDDPSIEYLVEMIAEVAACAFDEETDMCKLQCRMVSSNLDRKVPWQIYQSPCNHALYGAGCKVNREDFKTVAIISDIAENQLVATAFGTRPDGWFNAGFVKRESTGEIRFIVSHIGNQVTLQSPFVELNVGDEAPAYAGCDRRFSTCKTKFNNGNRFLGFPWVPSKNPFTENIYGTGSSPAGAGGSGGRSSL